MLADLESRFEAERRSEVAAQSAELAEAESAGVVAADRMRAATGRQVHLRTLSGLPVDGVLRQASSVYVLVDEGHGLQAVVPLAAVAAAAPLPGPAPAGARREPTMGAVLRELARRGVRVRLVLGAGEVVGRLVRVGADHVDVVVDPEGAGRAYPGVRTAVTSVMLAAVEVVRSR